MAMTESFIETVVGEAFDGMPPTLIAAAGLDDRKRPAKAVLHSQLL